MAAAAEGYDSIELLKRYTTATMGPAQGKLETVNTVAVLAEARGESIAEVGTTVWRPPYVPITLGALGDKIALITPGQKGTYVTDVVDSIANSEKIVKLARGSDHLFIEAVFLDQDREQAKKKHHLTARQAGHLAALAQAKQFTVFHFSPRYTEQEWRLQQEAAAAYRSGSR